MKTLFKTLALVLLVSQFSACASHENNKELNEKVSETKPLDSPTALNADAKETIDKSSNLTPEQKARLEAIRAEMTAQREELYKESLKLRSVLIQDIASQKEHVNEIKIIKARLKEIEDKRLDILFKAIDQANIALGKFAAKHEREMQETLKEDRMGRLEH